MTTEVTIKDTISNPGPLGLTSFGLTTILLNLHNAGLFPLEMPIIVMGIFIGGLTQLFAGFHEARKNNTFGLTAFTCYGGFWWTLVAIWLMPALGSAQPVSSVSLGWYLTLWGIFSAGMTVGAYKVNKVLFYVFVLLVALFALLAIATFTGSHAVHTLAGYVGIVCGGGALYLALAQIINEVWGRKFWYAG